jgi:hypothetical protein
MYQSLHFNASYKKNASRLVDFITCYKELKMEDRKTHFRRMMLYYYRKSKNVVQIRKKIYAIYGEDTVNDRMCQFWFAKC